MAAIFSSSSNLKVSASAHGYFTRAQSLQIHNGGTENFKYITADATIVLPGIIQANVAGKLVRHHHIMTEIFSRLLKNKNALVLSDKYGLGSSIKWITLVAY